MARPMSIVGCLWLFSCVYLLLPFDAFPTQDEVEAKVKAAGCFIPTPKGIVLGIGTVFRDIRIPFGSHEPGETARETAARETLEETGLDVAVGSLLRTFESDTAFLFHCTPKTAIEDYSLLRPVDTGEMAEVIVMDPLTMLDHHGRKITNAWRIPKDRDLLIELFEKYENKEAE